MLNKPDLFEADQNYHSYLLDSRVFLVIVKKKIIMKRVDKWIDHFPEIDHLQVIPKNNN